MFEVLLLLFVLLLSLVIHRVATVAFVLTGMSRSSAAFQARSALTGTGFTTSEAEDVVSHPVRRRRDVADDPRQRRRRDHGRAGHPDPRRVGKPGAEGVLVLGINRADGGFVGAPRGQSRIEVGDTLVLYGEESVLAEIDQRRSGIGGNLRHIEAVARRQTEEEEDV